MLSDEQRRRLEQEKKSFEQSYELQSEKIARLRKALVLETDPLRKFQYEQQIKNEETELKRLTDRLDEIENLSQGAIPVLKKKDETGSNPATTQTPQFQDEYYKWLISEYEKNQTEGFNRIGRLSLPNLFVPLKIAVNSIDKASPAIIPLEDDNTNSKEERTFFNFLVQDRRSIVLIGAAGSGKTTLLKYLTSVYARQQQQDFNKNAPELVPVLLVISEVYHKIFKNCELPDLIAEEAKHIVEGNQTTQLSQWFSEKLNQGQCLIMLDGLDEVADESQRKQVNEWVDKQRKKYCNYNKKNFIILTSRPLALKDAYLVDSKYAYVKNADILLEIKPFYLEQILRFIDRWYFETKKLESYGSNKSEEEIKIEGQQKAEHLKEQIINSSFLKKMAVNPLVLTMICTIHNMLETNKRLPEKLVDLYEEICKILLRKAQITQKNGVPYTVQDKQSALHILALKLMQKNDTKFELSEGKSWIIEQLANFEINNVMAEKLIKYFCEIGLLAENNKKYQFCHFSFQEYLAACGINKTKQERLLIGELESSWWGETILWYAALRSDTTVTDTLIREISQKRLKLEEKLRKSDFLEHKSMIRMTGRIILDVLFLRKEVGVRESSGDRIFISNGNRVTVEGSEALSLWKELRALDELEKRLKDL